MTPFTYNFFVIITNIKYVLGENIQIKIKKGKKDILYFGCILHIDTDGVWNFLGKKLNILNEVITTI